MRVLVTGACGQLSHSLQERAARRQDIEIVAVGRPALDLELPGSAARAIAAIHPDLVINAAAFTAVDTAEDEPERARRINADAAGEVAGAAQQAGAGIIQLSTDFVFDGKARNPYREDAATNPLSVYGQTKLAGEEAVRQANPDHLIVRTAWLYSPFGRNFVRTMVGAARTRDSLSVVDDQCGSPTSALDLADGLLTVVGDWSDGSRTGVGETYHLAGSGMASWCDLAQAVMMECAALGLSRAEVRPIASADWRTKAVRPAYSVLDSGRFARDFGFVMPDWRQALGEVVKRLAA